MNLFAEYLCNLLLFYVFFFNDTATTEIYTLSLHDALPIYGTGLSRPASPAAATTSLSNSRRPGDRKSTRLNSSHSQISYAVFCLKKKKLNVLVQYTHSERSALTQSPRGFSILLQYILRSRF